MAANLKGHLQTIGQPSMDLDGAKLVEQALLIGDTISQRPFSVSLAPTGAWQTTIAYRVKAKP